MMQLYPAIDIRGGQCVRLMQGRFDKETVYYENPSEAAENWLKQGATFLHVVDLDGALRGGGANRAAIAAITAAAGTVPVQVGGGIRTMRDIEETFALGVRRVILGTAAVNDPAFVAAAAAAYGARVAVGIDAKDEKVAVGGWTEESTVSAVDLCRQMAERGIRTVIYTDISKDGMMTGPNIESTRALIDAVGHTMDIIASGGVSAMADLDRVAATGAAGVIIGKALYMGTVDLKEAVARYERSN